MLDIRIIPIISDMKLVEERSFAYCNKRVYGTHNFAPKLMRHMFYELARNAVYEVSMRAEIGKGKKARSLRHILDFEFFIFLDRDGWNSAEMLHPKARYVTIVAAAAILWTQHKRFVVEHYSNHRRCTLCGAIQEGKTIGIANLTNTPIVEWEHDRCTNPTCISRFLDTVINRKEYEKIKGRKAPPIVGWEERKK